MPVSKSGIAVALLYPEMTANPWHARCAATSAPRRLGFECGEGRVVDLDDAVHQHMAALFRTPAVGGTRRTAQVSLTS